MLEFQLSSAFWDLYFIPELSSVDITAFSKVYFWFCLYLKIYN